MLAPLLALALAQGSPAMPSAPHFRSLQAGETLGAGSSQLAFGAGFSRFQATYAEAAGDGLDVGGGLDFDWLTSEAFANGFYRRIAWRRGDVALAWRARGGLYADLGATWAVSSNRSDAGVRLAPGAALSTRTARGVLALGADAPFTVTFSRGGGYALGLVATVSFETPLWGDLLAGARLGGGGLWSGSGAPFANESPRPLLDLTLLLTYRLF